MTAHLSADIWVDETVEVKVTANDNLATIALTSDHHLLATFFADRDDKGPVAARGPEGRTADLVVLRDLARRMLTACEMALAADRDKGREAREDALV